MPARRRWIESPGGTQGQEDVLPRSPRQGFNGLDADVHLLMVIPRLDTLSGQCGAAAQLLP